MTRCYKKKKSGKKYTIHSHPLCKKKRLGFPNPEKQKKHTHTQKKKHNESWEVA